MANTDTKKPISPIIFDEKNKKDTKLLAMMKSPEDKLYIIPFTDMETGINMYETVVGRISCFRAIERIVTTYKVDPKDIKLLVEYIVVDRETKEYEYALMHPNSNKSKTAYEFCKDYENDYGSSDFNIDDYTDDREGEQKYIPENERSLIDKNTIDVSCFEGSASMANMYSDIMKEKEKTGYDPKSLFAAPENVDDLFSIKKTEEE